MGVRVMISYPIPTEDFVRRLEKVLRATPYGKWCFTCTLHLPTKKKTTSEDPSSASFTKELYIFNYETEAPFQSYLVHGKTVLEAEPNIITVIANTKLYERRQYVVIRGNQYLLGDFVIRTGSITLGSANKGWILEIEYRPCAIPSKGEDILLEFIKTINIEPEASSSSSAISSSFSSLTQVLGTGIDFKEANLPLDNYNLRHTSYQYINTFQRMGLLKSS